MSTQKFPIGARIAVKKNLTLRGRVVDYKPFWVGTRHHPAKYDVVLDGDCYTREYEEDSLLSESRLAPNQTHIQFSDQHLPSKLDDRENCQLFLAMTGTKDFIKRKLQEIYLECQDTYGKPRQGVIACSSGSVD